MGGATGVELPRHGVAPFEFERNLRTTPGKPGRVFGDGRSRLRPVLLDDVVIAVAAAAERRPHGLFALEGPDTLTVDDLVRLVNQDSSKPISHTPAALGLLLAPAFGMRRAMARLFLADALEDAPNLFEVLGLNAAPLRSAWPERSAAA